MLGSDFEKVTDTKSSTKSTSSTGVTTTTKPVKNGVAESDACPA